MNKNNNFYPVIPIILFLIFSTLIISTAMRKSLVYDEVIYPAVGALVLKTGEFKWNPEHPPLQKYAAGLAILMGGAKIPTTWQTLSADDWHMGYKIFFQGKVSANKLIFLARIPSMFLALLLSIFIFFLIKKQFGLPAAIVATSAYCFDPLVLSNSALALNDIFLMIFFFLSVFFFQQCLTVTNKKAGIKWGILCGITTGLAIGSKFTSFLLGPIYLVLFGLHWNKMTRKHRKGVILNGLAIFAITLVIFICLYQGSIKTAFDSVKAGIFIHQIASGDKGLGFLLVPISSQVAWLYYPVTLFIKTPLPLLALWIFSIWVLRKKLKNKKFLYLWVPPVLIFASCMISKNQFGARFYLPMIPFLAILVGMAYHLINRKLEKKIFIGLVVCLAMESLIVHPHYMSYFNQLIGGSSKGYRWLKGSNQDWGQDLPALKKFIDKNQKATLLLSYVGSNRPESWGINYQDVLSPSIASQYHKDLIHPPDSNKEFLVISAHLLSDNELKKVFNWLKNIKPIEILGNTLFVYDISNDEKSAIELAKIYSAMGRMDYMNRQLKRVLFINPKNEEVGKYLVEQK